MPQRCLPANELQELSKPQPHVDQSITAIMATLKANSDRLKLILNEKAQKTNKARKNAKKRMNQALTTSHQPTKSKV